METDVVKQIDSYPNTPDIGDIFEIYNGPRQEEAFGKLDKLEEDLASNDRKGTFIKENQNDQKNIHYLKM